MAQEWGPNYYHFTVEHLPRITLALDILIENPDIMVSAAVWFPFLGDHPVFANSLVDCVRWSYSTGRVVCSICASGLSGVGSRENKVIQE